MCATIDDLLEKTGKEIYEMDTNGDALKEFLKDIYDLEPKRKNTQLVGGEDEKDNDNPIPLKRKSKKKKTKQEELEELRKFLGE